MAYLQARGNKFRARVRIPKPLRDPGGKEFEERTMVSIDRRSAKAEADAWEAGLRSVWAASLANNRTTPQQLRSIYEEGRRAALGGEYVVQVDGEEDPVASGIEFEIDKLAEHGHAKGLNEGEEVRLKALQDALSERRGQEPPRRKELEPGFLELANKYLNLWATQQGLKGTNVRQQKEASFRLFAGFIKDKPLRDVKRAEVADFMDELRRLSPNWARSPKSSEMGWAEIIKEFGGNATGLSAQTMNRHITTLSALWKWADQREIVEGRNPFDGFKQRIKKGVNQHPYLPWTLEELQALFDPPPKRGDLTEAMVVALHTGMRLDEIASLTLSQIKEEDGVQFIEVKDAKTPAGNRRIPLHRHIEWLADIEGEPENRVWPKFNPEGPGKKPGADAGKDFSNFKRAKGFTQRTKAFHSFRKNVTKCMERAGVPESDWAEVLGHERGITYGLYNPDGITLQRKAELIGLIDYPGLKLPSQVVER